MLKIKYFYDEEKNITGCKATDTEIKFSSEFETKQSGGLWVNGRQTIGHCDFYLTGSAANQRKQMRKIVMWYYNEARHYAGYYD